MCRVGAEEEVSAGEQPDEVEDELMEWCDALDFEQYSHEWRSMATTLGSEAFVFAPDELSALPAWSSVTAGPAVLAS
jgi:hypothetical protein